jgi:hypothetical protein
MCVIVAMEAGGLVANVPEGVSPEEAVAIVAALARFVRDTGSGPAPAGHLDGGWVRAARLEAVRGEPEAPVVWGGASGWI